MALTRANVEAVLVRRCGNFLAAADLDGTTASGANADLNDPIGWACRQLGLSVASITNVADADLAGVADADVDRLLDLAELRALESAAQNYDAVDLTAGPRTERLGQLGSRLDQAIARKRAQVARDHGFGLGTLTAGVISLGFQQQNEAGDAEL